MAALIGATGAASVWLRPSNQRNKDVQSSFKLEQIVPESFGGWRLQQQPVMAVNPQTQELLDKIYSQILARTYVDQSGYSIMLSISYGADQRGSLEAHKPEVCYPAQGFKLIEQKDEMVDSGFGPIEARRLVTQLENRHEPLTYWFTMGRSNVQSRWDKRLVEIQMALTGQIPDGLLFRVSSIDPDATAAWKHQDRFVQDLLKATTTEARARLAGLV